MQYLPEVHNYTCNKTYNIFWVAPSLYFETRVKPGSHMPLMYLRHSCRYHLGHFSDEQEHVPPATRATAELYRQHACEVELKSTSQACRG